MLDNLHIFKKNMNARGQESPDGTHVEFFVLFKQLCPKRPDFIFAGSILDQKLFI